MYEHALATIDRIMRSCAQGKVGEAVACEKIAKTMALLERVVSLSDEEREKDAEVRGFTSALADAVKEKAKIGEEKMSATNVFYAFIDKEK